MSELRRDLVSKDWIIMAPERARRLRALLPKRRERRRASIATCPFEDLKRGGEWPPLLSYPKGEKWEVAVIPNKYPALVHHQTCPTTEKLGPYELTAGSGHHDLVITRDHNKNFGDLSVKEAEQVLRILQERYRILAKDRCLLYTSTFFNWGPKAGASIYHPHYQVLTLPIIPPAIAHSLRGSYEYFRRHHRCVHCTMIAYERKERSRIVSEDRYSLALTPFVSEQPFEIRIFPKRHLPFFEKTPPRELRSLASVLQKTLRKIKMHLRDPDLNFFIHTAPLKDQKHYRHYHWHVEVVPKITILAGFELSTGVEINVVNPDEAALLLRR